MIVLFTDFGLEGPYTGQVKAVLYRQAPHVPVIDLFSDLPAYAVQGAAYLLGAYAVSFPAQTVFVCVVDPGVGSKRRGAVVHADGRWYVGPDNGLLNEVARRARRVEWWDIDWRPVHLSASFHGRDVFAPVAAQLASGTMPAASQVDPGERIISDWPEDLYQITYIDHYGNALTGIRAAGLSNSRVLTVRGHVFNHASTFSDVPIDQGFWYKNANGLVELAVNQGRACEVFALTPTDVVACASA